MGREVTTQCAYLIHHIGTGRNCKHHVQEVGRVRQVRPGVHNRFAEVSLVGHGSNGGHLGHLVRRAREADEEHTKDESDSLSCTVPFECKPVPCSLPTASSDHH